MFSLTEGAGLAFDISKVLKISKINYGCFKAVKLVKKVIIMINEVSTILRQLIVRISKKDRVKIM